MHMANYNKKSIADLDVAGKRVIVRVDFNVPLDKTTGEITDDKRIRGALPTIQYLVDHKAKVILVSHLGRPKNGPEAKFSMKPAVDRLSELLGQEVVLASDVIGEDAKAKAQALEDGQVLMLENVRFHKEETKNDPEFARELASLAELYVNDAFGTAHRAHASTAGLANYLPSACGFLIKKEIDVMGKALNDPARPFVAILGGAKVSDKIGVINNLIDKVDTLIIGGGMAYTFNVARGQTVGNSLLEEDKIELAKELMAKAEEKGVDLLLPEDNVIADHFAADADHKVVEGNIPEGWMGMDIGPKTVELYSNALKDAKTVVWNGPMGVFEFENFAKGTAQIAEAIANSDAISIIGGGDSSAAIEQLGYADKVTHISTGGGASLEFLEGKVLPGIDCLQNKDAHRAYVCGNWKMNKGVPADAEKFVTELLAKVKDVDSEILIAVPYTVLDRLVTLTDATNITVAAENCHFEDEGAYTGEISPKFLAKMGIHNVVLGHSERREYFGETDELVNKKVLAALNWGVRPIICVGESLEQREAGQTFDLVKKQVEAALANVPADRMAAHVTIAYEPIWAIGTGKTATAEQAEEVCAHIRQVIAELYCEETAENTRILYGGSMKAANAAELLGQKNIDGGLIGGASLKADDFSEIAKVYQDK
jgi:triosephosphate isomerase